MPVSEQLRKEENVRERQRVCACVKERERAREKERESEREGSFLTTRTAQNLPLTAELH